MQYLYSGKFDSLKQAKDAKSQMELAIEFLRVADVEFLDDIKIACELKLIELCDQSTYSELCEVAEKFNADRLKEFCGWYERTKLQKPENEKTHLK